MIVDMLCVCLIMCLSLCTACIRCSIERTPYPPREAVHHHPVLKIVYINLAIGADNYRGVQLL